MGGVGAGGGRALKYPPFLPPKQTMTLIRKYSYIKYVHIYIYMYTNVHAFTSRHKKNRQKNTQNETRDEARTIQTSDDDDNQDSCK